MVTIYNLLNFNITLEDETIILRSMIEEDFIHFKELSFDTEMWYYFTSDLSDESQLNKKMRLPFTVIDKSTNKVAGSTSFGSISERDSRLEIGWTWLGKNYQGSGINRKMKTRMLTYCFETLKLNVLNLRLVY